MTPAESDPDLDVSPAARLTQFLDEWPEMRTLRLENEQLTSQTARIPLLHGSIAHLEGHVSHLRAEAKSLRAENAALAREVRQLQREKAARQTERDRLVSRLEGELREIRRSESYRLGHGLVRLVRRMQRTPPGRDDRPAVVDDRNVPSPAEDAGETSETATDSGRTSVEEGARRRRCLLVDARGCERKHVIEAMTASLPVADTVRRVLVLDSHDFDLAQRWDMCLDYVPRSGSGSDRSGIARDDPSYERRWEEILAAHRPDEIYRPHYDPDAGAQLRLDYFAPVPER